MQEMDGLDWRILSILDLEYRGLWTVVANHSSSVELPALPEGYDRTADWPPEGGMGLARWSVNTALLVEADLPDDDLLIDQSFAQSQAALIELGSCRRRCEDRECGDDGCGGLCGPGCGSGFLCDEDSGTCEECVPECGDRPCGDDGCGGTCPPGCADDEACSLSGAACVPEAGGWISIAPATFMVGSPEDEIGRGFGDRELLHEVTLTRAYEILSTEVTQGNFEALMGYNPSTDVACGAACPVETVTWHEAAAYCNAFSAAEELELCYECAGEAPDTTCTLAATFATPYDCAGYRLPTGAEWEQAARAGTTTATYNGDIEIGLACDAFETLDTIAWWCGNAGESAHPVAQLDPNRWGLFDILGNVSEWCHDGNVSYTADAVTDAVVEVDEMGAREARSGDYHAGATGQASVRAARRSGYRRSVARAYVGFRPVRTLP